MIKNIIIAKIGKSGIDLANLINQNNAFSAIALPIFEIDYVQFNFEKLNNFDSFIFSSKYAVEAFEKYNIFHYLKGKKVFAIGKTTADLLLKNDITAIYPKTKYNSETLLPLLNNLDKKNRIAILRGQSGRNLIQEYFNKKSCFYENFMTYKRLKIDIINPCILKNKINTIVFTNKESQDNYIYYLKKNHDWKNIIMFVSNASAYISAKEQGFLNVFLLKYLNNDYIHNKILNTLGENSDK